MMAPVHALELSTDRELRELRHHLSGIPRGRGRRFPAALRQRIVAWLVLRRAQGAECRELALELGMSTTTLQRWLTARREPPRHLALRPVTMLDEPAQRSLTLVGPSGLRLEGLTLADVLALLQGLA